MYENRLSRRSALGMMAAGAAAAFCEVPGTPRFVTRGVVLYPWDLSMADWPERAHAAGITTIGLHAAQRLDVLVEFMQSARGQRFLDACQRLNVAVEYELHAFGTLLSRELYYSPGKDMFRMDRDGRRNLDVNCCPSSEEALARIAEKAVEYGRLLRPSTHRYFYWPDDAREWCHCPKCRDLSSSDQALLVENRIVAALRAHLDPAAELSHIAYGATLTPPKSVTPHPGMFLEFAPISRVYTQPIDAPDVALGGTPPEPAWQSAYLDLLEANLEVFPRATAQALEYWLDVSRFSGWNRPAVELPWRGDVVQADALAYSKRGLRHATTFATWIDADYAARFGAPPLAAYVQALNG